MLYLGQIGGKVEKLSIKTAVKMVCLAMVLQGLESEGVVDCFTSEIS